MDYLVIDLQKSAIDQKTSITTLLRKALFVAKKLKLNEFEIWINNELNGYKIFEDIPEYRLVHGELKGLNPYVGWIPTLFLGGSEMKNIITSRKVSDSITGLEYLMNTEGNQLCMLYPPEIEQKLGEMFDNYTQYKLFVSKSQYNSIIETVRTTVMNWAIKLEEDGILGEDMVFKEDEKQKAVQNNYTVNNFYGSVTNSQIQQHSNDSEQKI